MKKRKAELYVIRSIRTKEYLYYGSIKFGMKWGKHKGLAACFLSSSPGITIHIKLKELRESGRKVTFEEAY